MRLRAFLSPRKDTRPPQKFREVFSAVPMRAMCRLSIHQCAQRVDVRETEANEKNTSRDDIGRPQSRRLYHLDGDDDDCCQREGGEHVLQHVELRELLRESCLTGGHQHRDGGLCGRHRGLYVQHH